MASKVTFEQTLEDLEQIIHQIESGQIGLEDSIKQYEKGTKLIERCRTILNRAQKRVDQLMVDSTDVVSTPQSESE